MRTFDKELQFLFVVLGFIISWRDVHNDVVKKKYLDLDLENYTSFKIFSDVIRSHSWYLGQYRDLRNRKWSRLEIT